MELMEALQKPDATAAGKTVESTPKTEGVTAAPEAVQVEVKTDK